MGEDYNNTLLLIPTWGKLYRAKAYVACKFCKVAALSLLIGVRPDCAIHR